jgi:TatD DNase family protein
MGNIFIDTHAHLDFSHFKDDYKEVIERAKKTGVRAVICVGTSLKASKRAIEIANEYQKGIYATVSVHPIHVSRKPGFDYDLIKKLAKDKKVVAIGETGFDFHYHPEEILNQEKVFKDLLALAKDLRKPLIFHCREAREDFMQIVGNYASDFKLGRIRGVVHCFSDNLAFAKAILDLNLFISFTGIITYPKNEELQNVVREVPLNKMMIETDSPYIAPQSFRGERNEPVYVIEVAKKIAELKNISLEEVAKSTSKNAIEFFEIKLYG